MPDNKDKIDSPDNKRIDIHDPSEVNNWADSLDCTPKEIVDAVGEVGTSAEKVKDYLDDKKNK